MTQPYAYGCHDALRPIIEAMGLRWVVKGAIQVSRRVGYDPTLDVIDALLSETHNTVRAVEELGAHCARCATGLRRDGRPHKLALANELERLAVALARAAVARAEGRDGK